MTKNPETINCSVKLSHEHLVAAVREYLGYPGHVFWPFPDGFEVIDIDFGMSLEEDGTYNLDVNLVKVEE